MPIDSHLNDSAGRPGGEVAEGRSLLLLEVPADTGNLVETLEETNRKEM